MQGVIYKSFASRDRKYTMLKNPCPISNFVSQEPAGRGIWNKLFIFAYNAASIYLCKFVISDRPKMFEILELFGLVTASLAGQK